MPVLRGDLTVRVGRLDAPQSARGLAQSKTLCAWREAWKIAAASVVLHRFWRAIAGLGAFSA